MISLKLSTLQKQIVNLNKKNLHKKHVWQQI